LALRSLVRGSVAYSIGNLLPRVGNFLLLPIYVRFLSPADFGSIALVTSVSSLLAIGFRLGLDGSLMRLHFTDVDPRRQDRLLTTVATVTTVAAAIGAVLTAWLSWLLFAQLFAGLEFWPFGAFAVAIAFAMTFVYLPATLFRAREQPIPFLSFTAGQFGVTAAVTLLLVVALHAGAVGALVGQLAGGLAVLVVSVVLVWRAGGLVLDRRLATEALQFGLPLVPHGISGWVLSVSDRWLLSFLLPLGAAVARAQIGVYSLGYQLAYVVDLVAQSINAAWVPFFYRYGSTEQGPTIHREMLTVVTAAFAAVIAALSLNANLVVAIIARPPFAEAARVVPIVGLAFLAHIVYIWMVTVVFHARRTAVLPLISGASGAVNVGVNLVLIPRFGIEGAAWATLASFTSIAALTLWYAYRVYPVTVDWTRMAVLLAGAAGAALYGVAAGGGLSAGRILLDLGLSAAFAVAALAIARSPALSLRTLTREASRSLARAPTGG
jgi:O-antigen/teichoic acid export membrane protein